MGDHRHICLVLNKNNRIFLDSFIEALANHRIRCTPFLVDGSKDFLEQRRQLLDLLQQENIHHILSINEFYQGNTNLYDASILQQAQINVWYVDTMQHGQYMPHMVTQYHKLCTFEPTDIPFAKETYGLDITYVPFGAGRSLFCSDALETIEGRQYTYDVCFVGLVSNNSYRLDILNRVAKVCKEQGYRFALYGHFWHSSHFLQRLLGAYKFKRHYPALYPYVHNQKLSPQDVADLYRHSKICLNIHTPHHTGLNCRSFEIMGNGNFLLTDVKDTDQLDIQEGIHYDVYNDVDDIESTINYYMTHNGIRKQIAKRGAEHVRAMYTIEHLIGELLDFDWSYT